MEGSRSRHVIIQENEDSDLAMTENARSIWSSFYKDLTVEVEGLIFHLNNFPLISRSGRLNKLRSPTEAGGSEEIRLVRFPGGGDAFEAAVKFCYNTLPVEINSSNVVALRCAAEYLEMTENIEEGNLISKTEEFLTCVLSFSWIDSIKILQSCSAFEPWAGNLKIVQRCMDSIIEKAATEPSQITWPFTCSSLRQQYPFLYPSSLADEGSNGAEQPEGNAASAEIRNKKKHENRQRHKRKESETICKLQTSINA